MQMSGAKQQELNPMRINIQQLVLSNLMQIQQQNSQSPHQRHISNSMNGFLSQQRALQMNPRQHPLSNAKEASVPVRSQSNEYWRGQLPSEAALN